MLLPDHKDLLLRFNQFLPETYLSSAAAAAVDNNNHMGTMIERPDDDVPHPPKKKLCTRKHSFLSQFNSPSELFNRVRDRCLERNDVDFSVLIKFMDVVVSYSNKKINFHEVDQIFRNIFRADCDLYVESIHTLEADQEKSAADDLDLEFLKEGEREDDQMIKDRRSLYDEAMFVKEYCFYHADLVSMRMESTITNLNKNREKSLSECLTVLDFSCIQELYNDLESDSGEIMVKTLRSFDSHKSMRAREVVLPRLIEKQKQLKATRRSLRKVWFDIFEDINQKGDIFRHNTCYKKMKEASIYKSRQ